MNRFEKQIGLPGFSEKEQAKLSAAKLLIVGAGGLGCPVLLYLAGAGIGAIGIADGDQVSVSNLNRQVLYGEKDAGKSKALLAALYVSEKYSDIKIRSYSEHITVHNALDLIAKYDIVLDCTDNFSSRYLINDACVLLNKPLVFGAIFQHEGQVMAFDPKHKIPLHYRHVYPNPPSFGEIPDCNSTGVLGVLPGMIGIMMATEAIKLVSGFGTSSVNKIILINIKDNNRFETCITRNPFADSLLPADANEFKARDYSLTCSAESIRWNDIKDIEEKLLIDVREIYEMPKLNGIHTIFFPLSEINEGREKELDADILFVFCKSGARSKKAAKLLKVKFPNKKIFSIEGGIESTDCPIHKIDYEKI
jgi:adenylyltransferase/sulfurtransferase